MIKLLLFGAIWTLWFATVGFAYCPPVCGQMDRMPPPRYRPPPQEHYQEPQQPEETRPREARPTIADVRADASRLYEVGNVDGAIEKLSEALRHTTDYLERILLEGDWYEYWATKHLNEGDLVAAISAAEKSISEIGGLHTSELVEFYYTLLLERDLYDERVKWLEQLKSEYARKGHEMKECQKLCSDWHKVCIDTAQAEQQRRSCTFAYGRCREACVHGP